MFRDSALLTLRLAMKFLCALVVASFLASNVYACPHDTEEEKLRYELHLSRCRGNSCHDEIVSQGELLVPMDQEDVSSGFVGYTPVELHVASIAYQLRFDVSRELKQNQPKHLMIGFSGRVGSLTGKQVTWAEKSFTGKSWNEFDGASVSGNEYSEEEERTTPTLRMVIVRTSQPACVELDAFLAMPSKDTFAGLLELPDATCWAVIEKSDSRLGRLNRSVSNGNPWAAEYLAKHLKRLDGGSLEDSLVALGEFSDQDMERFLALASEGVLSMREMSDALTMLPLKLTDNLPEQLSYLEQRKTEVNRVTRQTVSVQKSAALKALEQALAEVRALLPNN